MARLTCCKCGKKFYNKERWELHKKEHLPAESLHRCNDCRYTTKTAYKLSLHRGQCHDEPAPPRVASTVVVAKKTPATRKRTRRRTRKARNLASDLGPEPYTSVDLTASPPAAASYPLEVAQPQPEQQEPEDPLLAMARDTMDQLMALNEAAQRVSTPVRRVLNMDLPTPPDSAEGTVSPGTPVRDEHPEPPEWQAPEWFGSDYVAPEAFTPASGVASLLDADWHREDPRLVTPMLPERVPVQETERAPRKEPPAEEVPSPEPAAQTAAGAGEPPASAPARPAKDQDSQRDGRTPAVVTPDPQETEMRRAGTDPAVATPSPAQEEEETPKGLPRSLYRWDCEQEAAPRRQAKGPLYRQRSSGTTEWEVGVRTSRTPARVAPTPDDDDEMDVDDVEDDVVDVNWRQHPMRHGRVGDYVPELLGYAQGCVVRRQVHETLFFSVGEPMVNSMTEIFQALPGEGGSISVRNPRHAPRRCTNRRAGLLKDTAVQTQEEL